MEDPESKGHAPIGASLSGSGKDVVEFSHTWTIENFNFFLSDNVVPSPPFSADADDGVEWCIKLYPNGVNAECKDYVSVFVCVLPGSSGAVSADAKVLMLNADGAANRGSSWCEPKRLKPGFGRGFPKFVKREDLLKDQRHFLPDNTLLLHCEVRYTVDTVVAQGPSSALKPEPQERILSGPSCEIHRSQVLSDVLLTLNGKKFNAHRATLSARSLFFKGMFERDRGRGDISRVEISDMDEDTLIELLQFIYTGTSENSDNMANLLATIDKHAKSV